MSGFDTFCFYCGMPAESTDHVVPQSIIRNMADTAAELNIIMRRRILTVCSCHECNSLLGASMQDSLQERKAYLKAKLRKRYSKALEMPDWSDADLAQVEGHIKGAVISGMNLKRIIKSRLSW